MIDVVSDFFSILNLAIVIIRALDYPRENGACLQMRLSFSPVAHFFLFLVQWTDCHLAGALGLLRILIYMVHCCLPFTFFVLIIYACRVFHFHHIFRI